MNTEGIIPAKGISTRIPQKNTIDFLGKPLLDYILETIIETNLFSKIVA